MSVRIVMVPFFEKVLGRERSARKVLEEWAESAVPVAKALAPVDEGDYRDSIDVDVVHGEVQLVARDWKSHWIEWGSRHNRAFAPLRNAARQVANRVQDA